VYIITYTPGAAHARECGKNVTVAKMSHRDRLSIRQILVKYSFKQNTPRLSLELNRLSIG